MKTTIKPRARVRTPDGDAIVTEVHANGKTVRVEMLGELVNGQMRWPRPLHRDYLTKRLLVLPN